MLGGKRFPPDVVRCAQLAIVNEDPCCYENVRQPELVTGSGSVTGNPSSASVVMAR